MNILFSPSDLKMLISEILSHDNLTSGPACIAAMRGVMTSEGPADPSQFWGITMVLFITSFISKFY